MIYQVVEPANVEPGTRAFYLGHVRKVEEVQPGEASQGCLIRFQDGCEGRFVNPITIVDEVRTRQMLARYWP